MEGKYLVINSGSSSVKFTLYEMPNTSIIAKGNVERIGKDGCSWLIKYGTNKISAKADFKNHYEAIDTILKKLGDINIIDNPNDIKGVGFRVLHGGTLYSDSVLIDDKVVEDIKMLTPLGPLHHPGAIAGIECVQKLLPKTPKVAVWDTAFHQTMWCKALWFSWNKP